MRFFIILFFLFPVFCSGEDKKQSNEYYALCSTYLSLREQPGKESKLLAKIPFKGKVTLLEQTGKTELMDDGIAGNWAKVRYDNKTGYVFGGYLTRFKPPEKTCPDLVSYISNNFKLRDHVLLDDTGDTGESSQTETVDVYENGIVVKSDLGWEWGRYIIYLPAGTIEEAYLITKYYTESINKSTDIPADQSNLALNNDEEFTNYHFEAARHTLSLPHTGTADLQYLKIRKDYKQAVESSFASLIFKKHQNGRVSIEYDFGI